MLALANWAFFTKFWHFLDVIYWLIDKVTDRTINTRTPALWIHNGYEQADPGEPAARNSIAGQRVISVMGICGRVGNLPASWHRTPAQTRQLVPTRRIPRWKWPRWPPGGLRGRHGNPLNDKSHCRWPFCDLASPSGVQSRRERKWTALSCTCKLNGLYPLAPCCSSRPPRLLIYLTPARRSFGTVCRKYTRRHKRSRYTGC